MAVKSAFEICRYLTLYCAKKGLKIEGEICCYLLKVGEKGVNNYAMFWSYFKWRKKGLFLLKNLLWFSKSHKICKPTKIMYEKLEKPCMKVNTNRSNNSWQLNHFYTKQTMLVSCCSTYLKLLWYKVFSRSLY